MLRCEPKSDKLALTLITSIVLSWKCSLLFTSAVYIQVLVSLDFIMESNTMNPNQTASLKRKQSDMGSYCLHSMLPKNKSRRKSRWQNSWQVEEMLKRLSLQLWTFFEMFYFLFKSFVKVELSYVFTINLFTIAENCTEKWIILWKQVCL